MVKHRPLSPLSSLPLKGLVNLWRPSVWRTIWSQSQRYRWRSLAAEVTFLWSLGLLGASFALLQISEQQSLALPRGALQLARWLRLLLTIPLPQESSHRLGLPVLLLLLAGAGVCFVAGTAKLSHGVATVYQGNPSRRSGWVGQAWPWLITLVLGVTLLLVSSLVGMAPPPPSESSLDTAFRSWSRLTQLLRGLASLGLTALSLGLVHRLSPQRWPQGCPLWPGVGLTLGLGSATLMISQWGWRWLQAHDVAYGLFLVLGLGCLSLFLTLWWVPIGAQFNISGMVGSGGPGSGGWPPRSSPPPPSFDSFKINR